MRHLSVWSFVIGLAVVLVATSIPVRTGTSGWKVGSDAATAATKNPVHTLTAREELLRLRRQEELRLRLEEQRRLEEDRRARQEEMRKQAVEAKVKDTVDQARKAIAKSDLSTARKLIDIARQQARPLGENGQADIDALNNEFLAAGRKLLQAADDTFAAGKHVEAIKQYQNVAVAMIGTPVAQEAEAKIKAAKNDPAVKAAIHEGEAERVFSAISATLGIERKRLAEGSNDPERPATQLSDVDLIASMPVSKKASLVKDLRFLKKEYSDTEPGKKGVELLTKLEADKKLIQAIEVFQEDEKARQAFQMAEMYHKANLQDKAAAGYRDILKNYPKSEYAAKAKARLGAIKPE
jgi:hypothetical protein